LIQILISEDYGICFRTFQRGLFRIPKERIGRNFNDKGGFSKMSVTTHAVNEFIGRLSILIEIHENCRR